MSLSNSGARTKDWNGGRQGRRLLAAAVCAFAAAGCVHPVYGNFGSSSMEQTLQTVQVEPIPDRIGHYLANDLMFKFNGSSASVPPRYKLVVKLSERMQAPTIDTVTSRATSATIITDATFELLPINGGAAVMSGAGYSVASYDRFSQRMSNVRAARDAEIRDAKALSDQIFTEVRAKFLEKGL